MDININAGYSVIETELEKLKSAVRMRDFGVLTKWFFSFSIFALCVSALALFVSSRFPDYLDLYITWAGRIVPSVALVLFISSYFELSRSKDLEFRIRYIWYYVVYLILACLLVFQPYKKIADENFLPMIFYIICALMGGLALVYVIRAYLDNANADAIRDSVRAKHQARIKYYFLGVITGDDKELCKFKVDNKKDGKEKKEFDFGKKNEGLINKIKNDKSAPFVKRFEGLSKYSSERISDEIKDLKGKINIGYAAVFLSTMVSYCVTALNKIYDSAKDYISTYWKADCIDGDLIDKMPKEKAVELAEYLMKFTIVYQILIALTIACVFLIVYVVKSFLNLHDSTKLNNYKVALASLWELQCDLSDIKD